MIQTTIHGARGKTARATPTVTKQYQNRSDIDVENQFDSVDSDSNKSFTTSSTSGSIPTLLRSVSKPDSPLSMSSAKAIAVDSMVAVRKQHKVADSHHWPARGALAQSSSSPQPWRDWLTSARWRTDAVATFIALVSVCVFAASFARAIRALPRTDKEKHINKFHLASKDSDGFVTVMQTDSVVTAVAAIEDDEPLTATESSATLKAVSLACGAAMFFGSVHWMTMLVQHESVSAWVGAHDPRDLIIELMCVSSAILASALSHMLVPRDAVLANDFQRLWAMSSSSGICKEMVAMFAVGPLHYLALATQRAFLERDIGNSAPLMALESTDMVPVTLVMSFCFGESVPLAMAAGMGLMMISNFTIGFSVGFMEGLNSDPFAVGLSIAGMLLFALAAICMRVSSKIEFSACCTFIIRCQTLAIVAAIGCLFRAQGRLVSVGFIAVGFLFAAIQDLGLFCATAALGYPYAGPVCAIWGSNSVVVLTLNYLVLGELPSWLARLAMFGAVLGIWVCAFAS